MLLNFLFYFKRENSRVKSMYVRLIGDSKLRVHGFFLV